MEAARRQLRLAEELEADAAKWGKSDPQCAAASERRLAQAALARRRASNIYAFVHGASPTAIAALRAADAAFARLMAAGTVVDDGTADAVRAVRAALDAAEGRA